MQLREDAIAHSSTDRYESALKHFRLFEKTVKKEPLEMSEVDPST